MPPRIAILALMISACATQTQAVRPPEGQVVPGVEVLLRDSLDLLRGKRVGLITNASGRDRKGTSTIDLLFHAPDVKLVALFGPEHGLRGVAEAGVAVASDVDSATGVPIYSLFGEITTPTPAMLAPLDVLVYDIQDVGARVYTYQWTMVLAAAAAKKAGKPFIVLDRPNPIRADRFEGNVLRPAFASFVGLQPVPLRYGFTPGELLRYLVGKRLINADVTVVPMSGYRRSMWWEETGIPWINPSPNLRGMDAVILYPGTVMFEGTSASEGRGTEDPFRIVGASWLTDAAAIADELNAKHLAGVRFAATTRAIVPTARKFAGQTIPMIEITITGRNKVNGAEVGVHMLRAMYRRHPAEFTWRLPQIDRLAGTDELRKAVEQEGGVERLLEQWRKEAAAFEIEARPFLIYH
ncbi:MAG: DUF1343 domain-containing protein [Gemmatimonadaceae bacterium]|nr:DUF1343 domain-containing protein [Gemmatimonadaceae bacterium]